VAGRRSRRLGSEPALRYDLDPRSGKWLGGSQLKPTPGIVSRARRPYGEPFKIMLYRAAEGTGGGPAWRDDERTLGFQYAMLQDVWKRFYVPGPSTGRPPVASKDKWPGVVTGMATSPWPVNPGGSVTPDNSADISLKGVTPRHIECIEEIVKLYYGKDARVARAKRQHLTKLDSSSGIPLFTRNQEKLDHNAAFFSAGGPGMVAALAKALVPGNYPEANKHLAKLHDAGLFFNGWPGSRIQPMRKLAWDGTVFRDADPDTVLNWRLERRSLGRLIEKEIVTPEGKRYTMLLPRGKFRVVHMQPSPTNDAYQLAHETLRELAYAAGGQGLTFQPIEVEYAEAERLPLLDEFDVASCDRNMPADLYWVLQRARQRTIGYPSVAAWMGLLNVFSPRFSVSDTEGERGACVYGETERMETATACTGNPSGTGDNSDNNRDIVGADIVDRWAYANGWTVQFAAAEFALALRHEHPEVSIDQRGDDVKVRTRDEAARKKYVIPLTIPPAGRFVYTFGPKKFPEFEGRQEVEYEGKRLITDSVAAILEKLDWSERGVEDKVAPGKGMQQRVNALVATPVGPALVEDTAGTCTRFLGRRLPEYADAAAASDPPLEVRNEHELDFLMNTEKLVYKEYPPGAISDKVKLTAYAIEDRRKTQARYTVMLDVDCPAIPEE
jgi:hypothetical protein